MAHLLATFVHHRERLAQLQSRILVLECSGAAGTLATLAKEKEMGCQGLLAQEPDLQTPAMSWHTELDNIAEFSSFLAHKHVC